MVPYLQDPRWKAREPVCFHWRVQEQEVNLVPNIISCLANDNRYATDIVRECAEAWEKLITGKTNPGDVSTYALPH